jgi:hypothetical protein
MLGRSAQLVAAVWGLSAARVHPGPDVPQALAEELWSRPTISFTPRDMSTLLAALIRWQEPDHHPSNRHRPHLSTSNTAQGGAQQAGAHSGGQSVVPAGLQQMLTQRVLSPTWQRVVTARCSDGDNVQRGSAGPNIGLAQSVTWLLMSATRSTSPEAAQVRVITHYLCMYAVTSCHVSRAVTYTCKYLDTAYDPGVYIS